MFIINKWIKKTTTENKAKTKEQRNTYTTCTLAYRTGNKATNKYANAATNLTNELKMKQIHKLPNRQTDEQTNKKEWKNKQSTLKQIKRINENKERWLVISFLHDRSGITFKFLYLSRESKLHSFPTIALNEQQTSILTTFLIFL